MILFENFTLKYGSKILLKDYYGGFLKQKLIGLIGPNGSGKTSLLRALAGLNPRYTGHLFLYQKELSFYSIKDLASLRTYIPATPLCHWPLSTQQILSIENPLFHPTHPVLAMLEIRPLLSQNFLTLSSGEKARIFLAYTLIKNTDILILDEITSHLDEYYQDLSFRLLKEWALQGKTIFISLHQKDLAFRYCDQVLCLENQNLISLKRTRPTLVEVQ